MRILILGADGAQGRALALALTERGTLRGTAIARLGLADAREPEPVVAEFPVVTAAFDIADRAKLDRAQEEGWDALFHLFEVGPQRAQEDFVAGLRGNFFGCFNVLESCRAAATRPLVVFGSTAAAGEPVPPDGFAAHKRIGELLTLDYCRRGFIDGRIVRLGEAPDPEALIAAANHSADDLPENRTP